MKLYAPFRWLLIAWAGAWLGLVTTLGFIILVVLTLFKVPEHRLQWIPRLWARCMLWAVCCRVKVQGLENINPEETYIFACNHTSALDILALMSVLPPNFRWIAKKELFEIPVFGPAMRRAGYIPIDRSNNRAAMKSLNQAARRINQGASVVIFPEGTRSESGRLLPFKSGGLALAIRSRRPVVPVAIQGAARALPPKTLHLNPGTITITLGKPVPTQGMKLRQRDELAQRMQQEVQKLLDG